MNKQEHDNQTLEDLPVTDGQSGEAKGGVSINYAKIEFEYKPQRSDGSLD